MDKSKLQRRIAIASAIGFISSAFIIGFYYSRSEKAFWKQIYKSLERDSKRVRENVDGTLYGATVFLEMTPDGIKEIGRFYAKKQGADWTETTVGRKLSPKRIPRSILKELSCVGKLDITDRVDIKVDV